MTSLHLALPTWYRCWDCWSIAWLSVKSQRKSRRLLLSHNLDFEQRQQHQLSHFLLLLPSILAIPAKKEPFYAVLGQIGTRHWQEKRKQSTIHQRCNQFYLPSTVLIRRRKGGFLDNFVRSSDFYRWREWLEIEKSKNQQRLLNQQLMLAAPWLSSLAAYLALTDQKRVLAVLECSRTWVESFQGDERPIGYSSHADCHPMGAAVGVPHQA